MKKVNNYQSRKTTPWTGIDSATPLEKFITKTYEDKYANRHKKIDDSNEASFLNEYNPVSCPYCNNANIIKNGKYSSGIQKYKCTECYKTFNILTNTIFHNHKISISEWIEFLLYLFGYESTNAISKGNRNSHSTTKYWIKKLFLVVEDYQNDIVLKGDVYIDEAFYKVVKSEIKYKDDEQNIEYRGLSKNQICIGVAKDENKIFAKVEGFGKTDNEKTLNTFKEHIKQGSKIIHDSEKSQNSLISCLNLSSESYNGNDLKKLNDEDNPLDPINKTILYMRKFLNAHSGFDRDELQGYLDLFVFISNEKGTSLDKVNKIVDLSINKRISLKYREYYRKKD